jgi:hypothetical protein
MVWVNTSKYAIKLAKTWILKNKINKNNTIREEVKYSSLFALARHEDKRQTSYMCMCPLLIIYLQNAWVSMCSLEAKFIYI